MIFYEKIKYFKKISTKIKKPKIIKISFFFLNIKILKNYRKTAK